MRRTIPDASTARAPTWAAASRPRLPPCPAVRGPGSPAIPPPAAHSRATACPPGRRAGRTQPISVESSGVRCEVAATSVWSPARIVRSQKRQPSPVTGASAAHSASAPAVRRGGTVRAGAITRNATLSARAARRCRPPAPPTRSKAGSRSGPAAWRRGGRGVAGSHRPGVAQHRMACDRWLRPSHVPFEIQDRPPWTARDEAREPPGPGPVAPGPVGRPQVTIRTPWSRAGRRRGWTRRIRTS